MNGPVLSTDPTEAARCCLSALLPVSDGYSIRLAAAAFTERGDQLRRLTALIRSAGTGDLWRGVAQQAYATSVAEQLPSLTAAANMYLSYAAALTRYASLTYDLAPQLQSLRRSIDRHLVLPAGPGRDAQLRADTARFTDAHTRWTTALTAACDALRRADGANPLRDRHGFHLLLSKLDHALRFVDPVGYLVLHPSLANLSHALSTLGTELTVLGVALLFVCPPAAAVCMTVATVLSAAQLAVDATRRTRGEHVGMAVLGMDAFGALPIVGRGAKEVEEVSKAVEELAPSERHVIDLVPGGGLQQHEGLDGGHVLLKHSGKGTAYVADRLVQNDWMDEASSFFDRATAEQAISDTIKDNTAKVQAWLAGSEHQLKIDCQLPYPAGFLVRRGTVLGTAEHGVLVVLRRTSALGTGFRIHTAMVTE